MYKGKLSRSYLLFFVSLLVTLNIVPMVAFAERSDVDSVCYITEGQGAVAAICAKANDTCEKEILIYTSDDGILSFSNREYNLLDIDAKRKFMEVALLSTKEGALGSQVQSKVYNFIADQDSTASAAVKHLRSDVSADFVTASSWFRPFSGPISTILGLLCLLIFIFMGLSVVVDTAYIVLPGFQLLVEHGETGKKPSFISKEAWKSNKEAENSTNYKSALSLYVKRRIGLLFFVAICLGYVISGQIYDILVYFIDAFSSF